MKKKFSILLLVMICLSLNAIINKPKQLTVDHSFKSSSIITLPNPLFLLNN